MSDSVTRKRLWLDALRGFYARDLPVERLDAVSRWLYAGRVLILVISVQAAVIAALLAAPSSSFAPWLIIPLVIGYAVAHAISNLSNDYFGYKHGHDTADSPRVTYTIHPLAHGVLSKEALRGGLWILWGLALVIAAFFVVERGYLAAVLVAAGVAVLYLYDAAPRSLKSVGLGEISSLLVWGPLMIGGGYFCLTGRFSWPAIGASLPYGLGIAAILTGKHIDQARFDRTHGVRTLPVILGDRASRIVNQTMVVAMYAIVLVLVALKILTPFALIVFINAPAAWKLLAASARPQPSAPPAGYVGWPLWFHRFNLVHNRRFGWLYILGLAAGAAWALAGFRL